MKLGLKFDEVRLEDHTSEWSDAFIKVKKELMEHTNLEDYRIEHIGSTAIKDMPAKPIIDMLVGIDDLQKADKSLFKAFYKADFLRLKVKRPGEIVLAKFTDGTYEEKTHFIHLVEYREKEWNDRIFFRDYLNAHKEARDQYLDIKREYIKRSQVGINEYTHSKEGFVEKILNKRNI